MRTIRQILVLSLFVAVGAALGCDDSDDNGNDTMTQDVPAEVPAELPAELPGELPAELPTELAGDTPVEVVETGLFKATLIEFGSNPPLPVEGADLAVIDDTTGLPTGQTLTSGAGGKVELTLPKGTTVGFKASMLDYHDTYQFGIDSEAQAEILYIVTETLYALAPALAGLDVDPTKAILGGSIYWVNGESKEEFVGCATVESTPAGDYRYFDPATGRPTTLDKAAETSKTLSYFLAANLPAGPATAPASVTVDAKIAGATAGTTNIWAIEGAICIQNIYVTGAANPTPAACTK